MIAQPTAHTSLPFEELDALLARHPFGNYDYIIEQLHTCYERRLGKIATHIPVARQLLDRLSRIDSKIRYRVIGDTVFRCAIQHAHAQIESGSPYGLPLDDCAEVLRQTLRLLDDGAGPPLGSALVQRVGTEPYHGWIWSEDSPDDVFRRAFKQIVRSNYESDPCSPNPSQLAMLAGGARLLHELLPHSSRSALTHAHLVAVFPQVGAWANRLSSSEFRISGTIFLSERLLSNPWTTAEHLFHESLHQQIYDFRQAHSLLNPDFIRRDAPLIHSLWNRPDATRGNFWDIHRALAAFHVYVHLALLCSVAEARISEPELARYGPIRLVGRQTALARAHYLAEQIRTVCWNELGVAGRRFVDWFASILNLIDPTPPVSGSYVHLLLDRYWREAREVGREHRPALADHLRSLIDQEIETTRSVLAEMRRNVSSFDTALAHIPDTEPETRFLAVRTLIAQTLLDQAPCSYRLSESKEPDELVRQMVERSSETLRICLERPGVA